MFVSLAVPLALGWLLARRLLQEDTRYGALAHTLGLALALTLLLVNGFYHHFSLGQSVGATLALEGLAIALLAFLGPKAPAWGPARLPKLAWLTLLVILYFTSAQQVANPDDDYWIHTPLQGLMLHGSFPPTNPFFSEIPMNGHYGRNLSLVTVAYLSGQDMFFIQHWMTCLIQCLTFALLFRGLEYSTGSRPQALLGAGMMFFGINVGGRGGLMDTLQNNNAYVHLYLALYLALISRCWKMRSYGTAALSGLVLGGYAIIYETHYGLSVLASLAVLPLARRNLPLVFLALAISVPISATQGGPITNIVQRKLSGAKEVEASTLSKGMQNQAQVIKLTVPKAALFQILLEQGEYQRESYVYTTDTFLRYLHTKSPGRGYRYLWSWDVLKLHFLPLYLAPFSAWWLIRRRNLAGAWLWSFGAISYVIPGLVDFGPIYESEYFRWEVAAGVGFSAALGVVVGGLWESYQGDPDELDWTYDAERGGLRLELHRRAWSNLALIAFLWLATVGSGQFLRQKVVKLADPFMPSSQTWLQRHAFLDFQPIDWKAGKWLEKRLETGDRLLTNFHPENNFSILFESTLTGVCGARCVGHALPLDDEIIGTTPYHMAPPATAFWKSKDPHFLQQMAVKWVYLRPDEEVQTLEGIPGLEKVYEDTEGSQRRLIYRYTGPLAQVSAPGGTAREGSLRVLEHLKTPAPFRLTAVEFPDRNYRGAQYAEGSVELVADHDVDLRNTTLSYIPTDKTVDSELLEQPLPDSLKAGVPQRFPFRFVAPHEEGQYALRFEWKAADGWHPVSAPDTTMAVDFVKWLDQLKVTESRLSPERSPSALVECQFQLQDPSGRLLRGPQKLLGSIAAVREPTGGPTKLVCGEGPDELVLLPGVYMQDLELGPDLKLKLGAVLPDKPGHYQLDLFLSPQQGQMVRYAGPRVEVRP